MMEETQWAVVLCVASLPNHVIPITMRTYPYSEAKGYSMDTQEKQSSLAELRAQMSALVREREAMIAWGEHLIKNANREFDRQALELGREINRLQDQQQSKPSPSSKPKPVLDLAGLTEDEIDHFNRLLNNFKQLGKR